MFDATIRPARGFSRPALVATLPLIFILAAACVLLPRVPEWQAMWLIAIAIYAGLKILTLAECPAARRAPTGLSLGYLLLWPGMNARAFFDARVLVTRPTFGEWLLLIAKLAAGLLLLFAIAPRVLAASPLVAGWIGMTGLVLVLHFGLFHFLSLAWRRRGIEAKPIMDFPIRSASLGDFWGRRWNRAFRDLAFGQLLRPLAGRIGITLATLAVFFFSGLVHELVISVPVRGGYGGPTAYFMLQGIGLLLERSAVGHRLGLGRGITGRLTCALFVVAPLGLLFQPVFIRHAILPTLTAIGAI